MNNWQRVLFVLGMLIVIAASFFLFQGAQSQQPNTLQAVTFSAVGTGSSINEKNTGVAWHQIVWRTNGTVSTCTIGVDSSVDGSSWNSLDVITGQTCTSNGSFTVAAAAYYNFVRIHVTVLSGGGSVTAVYMGWTNNPTAGGGASFPLTSPTANPAVSGQLRLANNTDKICWRNAAGNGDDCIYFDSSDVFQVGGAIASAPSGGVGGTLTMPEGTCSAPSAGNSIICAKSDHTLQYSVNGGALAQLAPITGGSTITRFQTEEIDASVNLTGPAQNTAQLWPIYIPQDFKISNFNYFIQTADNTAHTYDLGLYKCTNASGGYNGGATSSTLLAHTGSTAGTVISPASNYASITIIGAPISGTAGWYVLALGTGSASPTFTLGGALAPIWVPFNYIATGQVGIIYSGGLPSTVTCPVAAWGKTNQVWIGFYM